MADDDIEKMKIELNRQSVEIERARLELERSFSRQYVTPFLGVVAAVVAGLFTMGQVWVAWLQKEKEITSAQIQKQRDTEIAASEAERRWKLDLADFVFKNRETIFSTEDTVEQKRIFKIIAVTFPANISAILLEDLRQALPASQYPLIDASQELVATRQRMSPVEVGIDRSGSDYKDFRASTVNECSEACRKEPSCRAFSFNLTANQCWLKGAVPLRRENANFSSGVKVSS